MSHGPQDASAAASRTTPVREHRPIEPLLRPFQEFARLEAGSGLLLLACTVLALVWANSPWSASYASLWQTHVSVGFGRIHLSKELIHWINDGLMAVFFFVADLAFGGTPLLGIAKLGVLTASVLAGLAGYAAVLWASRAPAVAVQGGTVS